MNRPTMRSSRGRASGLGSAKEGVRPWWLERVTAVALIPLTLWFTASIVRHTNVGYTSFVAWLRTPSTAILMVLLLIALFHHLALGLSVVIEDYIHTGFKWPVLIAMRLACVALTITGVLAMLRICFAG